MKRRGPPSSLPRRARACVLRAQRQGRCLTCAAPPRAPGRQRLFPQRKGSRSVAHRPRPRGCRSIPDRARSAALPACVERRRCSREIADRGQGGQALPDAVEAILTCAGRPARRATSARLAGLTPREIEVLRLIAAGDTAKEAARKLDIAPKTADNHIQSLYSKIGVTTRAGAALFALEQGLVA